MYPTCSVELQNEAQNKWEIISNTMKIEDLLTELKWKEHVRKRKKLYNLVGNTVICSGF